MTIGNGIILVKRDDGEFYLFCSKCKREIFCTHRIINDLRRVFGEREKAWRWIILFVLKQREIFWKRISDY